MERYVVFIDLSFDIDDVVSGGGFSGFIIDVSVEGMERNWIFVIIFCVGDFCVVKVIRVMNFNIFYVYFNGSSYCFFYGVVESNLFFKLGSNWFRYEGCVDFRFMNFENV